MFKEEKDGAKPQYGPPMSPAVFAQKWNAKFEDLLATKFFGVDKSNAHWIGDVGEAGYEHLLHFHAQAKELDLQAQDFPRFPSAVFEKPPSTPRAQAAELCNANPFATAATLIHMLHPLVGRLQAMRHGQRIRGFPWQSFPLSVRQQINELILNIEKARQAGWWTISEKEDMELMKDFGEREQLGALRHGLQNH